MNDPGGASDWVAASGRPGGGEAASGRFGGGASGRSGAMPVLKAFGKGGFGSARAMDPAPQQSCPRERSMTKATVPVTGERFS